MHCLLYSGIAGHVAQDGVPVLVPDAYADARFSREFDKKTGFVTRNMICVPVFDSDGGIVAVLQVSEIQQYLYSHIHVSVSTIFFASFPISGR